MSLQCFSEAEKGLPCFVLLAFPSAFEARSPDRTHQHVQTADTLQSHTHPETWTLSSEGSVRADGLNPWYYKVSANSGCLATALTGSRRESGNSEVICHSGRNWVKIPNTWVAFLLLFFQPANFPPTSSFTLNANGITKIMDALSTVAEEPIPQMLCAEPWGQNYVLPSCGVLTFLKTLPNWVSGVCLCLCSTGLLAKIAQAIKITE